MNPRPSVCRMVHLIDRYSPHDCLAAIVTRVPNGAVWLVDLAVFNRGIDFMNGVSFEESGTIPGTWHWPERVEES